MAYRRILLVMLAAVCLNLSAAADPIVSFAPGTTVTASGASFSVNIDISGVTNLYAWQFDISFDPTILSASELLEGSFLSSGGSTIFFPGIIDNTSGTITFNADSLVGDVLGVSGDGTLATLRFQTLAAGATSLGISNLVLLDASMNEITATSLNGTVEAAMVPEPASWLLVSSGLGMFGVWRRCRSASSSMRTPRGC